MRLFCTCVWYHQTPSDTSLAFFRATFASWRIWWMNGNEWMVSRYSLSIWLETEVLRNDQKKKKTTEQFVLIIDGDVLKFLAAVENKTTQRNTQNDVAFVMTFRVNCREQKQKQPTLAVSFFLTQQVWKIFLIIINYKPDFVCDLIYDNYTLKLLGPISVWGFYSSSVLVCLFIICHWSRLFLSTFSKDFIQ